MKPEMKESLVEEGIRTIYKELGPAKTVRFFQVIGVSRGDTLKEIEEKTAKLSKEEALDLIKRTKVEER